MSIMSFARTGEAAMKNYMLTNEAVAKNSWDPNTLIKESIKARSAEKQAMATADASKAVGKSKDRMLIAKAKDNVNLMNFRESEKKLERKAGLVAAAGKYAATALTKTPDPKKPYQSDVSGMYDSTSEFLQGRLTRIKEQRAELETQKPAEVDPTSSTPGTLPPVSSAQAISAGKGSAGSGTKYDLTALTDFAIQGGFSPQKRKNYGCN